MYLGALEARGAQRCEGRHGSEVNYPHLQRTSCETATPGARGCSPSARGCSPGAGCSPRCRLQPYMQVAALGTGLQTHLEQRRLFDGQRLIRRPARRTAPPPRLTLSVTLAQLGAPGQGSGLGSGSSSGLALGLGLGLGSLTGRRSAARCTGQHTRRRARRSHHSSHTHRRPRATLRHARRRRAPGPTRSESPTPRRRRRRRRLPRRRRCPARLSRRRSRSNRPGC